jgi:hypothetical protein
MSAVAGDAAMDTSTFCEVPGPDDAAPPQPAIASSERRSAKNSEYTSL